MEVQEVINEINNLKELMNIIDSNVKFNIQILWGILSLIVAILSFAGYYLIKSMVLQTIESKINSELEKRLVTVQETVIDKITYRHKKFHPTLIMGWRNIEGYKAIECWKDEKGYVRINGIICDGVINETAIRLPNGYAPSNNLTIPLLTYGMIGECTIDIKGNIIIKKGDKRYIKFNNVMFKALE